MGEQPDGVCVLDDKSGTGGGQAAADLKLERFKAYVGLAKFALGTFALGAVTIYFNHQLQVAQLALEDKKASNALALEEKKAEVQYLSTFSANAMDKDLKSRVDFADYMQSVALSERLQKIWSTYYAVLVRKISAKEAERAELEAKIEQLDKRITELYRSGQLDDRRARALTEQFGVLQEIRQDILRIQNELDRTRYRADAKKEQLNFVDVIEKARTAERLGNFKEQIELLLGILDHVPRSVRPYVLGELSAGYRALQDFPTARKYAEQVVAESPEQSPSSLVNLAIMQKNDGELGLALKTLKTAAQMSSGGERLNIDLIVAGYLIHDRQRDEGLRRFEALEDQLKPRDAFIINIAWFNAVAGREAQFYDALERALKVRRDDTLVWIEQEVDIAEFKKQKRFKELVETARAQPSKPQ